MSDLPDPTTEQVVLWLKNGLSQSFVHTQGWIEANRRFHGITRATRPYIQANFKTPEEQAAAFDGLTLALLTIGHFERIQELSVLLTPSANLSKDSKQNAPANSSLPSSRPDLQ
jgi:hypothetical protein